MFTQEHISVTGDNINDLWVTLYSLIKPDTEKLNAETSRDGDVVGEMLNTVAVLKDPTRNILTSPIRKLPMRYAIGELLWYRSKNPSLRAIQLYTKAWDRMSDDGETVNSNYGHIIYEKYDFNQYEYCKELLKNDPNTRQAVIHIKTPRNTLEYPTKDLNCTVALQFFVRDKKLYLTTYMRSNDLWMGFPYDIFQFTCLQIQMAMELGLDLGDYTHFAGSLHLYKRDYEVAIQNEAKNTKDSN